MYCLACWLTCGSTRWLVSRCWLTRMRTFSHPLWLRWSWPFRNHCNSFVVEQRLTVGRWLASPVTVFCKPECPRTTCDEVLRCHHFRSFWTKNRRDRNNWFSQISQWCCIWDIPNWWSSSYLLVFIGQRNKQKRLKSQCLVMPICMPLIALELTFAGLRTFWPLVINIFVANSSTVLEPSTTRSATTDSAWFPECSTLCAC